MKKKKKICFVSTLAYALYNPKCKETFGGSEVQCYLLAKEFAKHKEFDVHVVVGDFGQKAIEKYDGVSVHKSYQLKKNMLNYAKAPLKLFGLLRKINPDIVIQRSAAPESGICAAYSKLHKKKFIYSVAHDMDVNGEFASKGLVGKMYNYGISNADTIIFQNEDQVKHYSKWKLKGKKMKNSIVIKTGYEVPKLKKQKKDHILWVSRSDTWKRPEVFIELAKQFPKTKFTMIMQKSSESNIWKKYSKQAQKLSNMTFIEKVPFAEIQKYFNSAKLFVNTSKYEGFPNTFIQSCIGSTPIVSLNVNPDNFLGKHKCGIFCENSIDELHKGVELLLKNENIYKELSIKCNNYAKKHHEMSQIIQSWIKQF